MKNNNANYPHPVLSSANEDYINSNFEIFCTYSAQGQNAIIDLEYVLNCDGLKSLIDKKEAKVLIYLESLVAEYRKTFDFENDQTKLQVVVNTNDINKNLQVRGYIVATQKIENFSLEEHNKYLFSNMPFYIRKGDVLAVSNVFFNIAINDYDPLSDKQSIFAIHKNPNQKYEVVVDYTSDAKGKIAIYLNEETYGKYCNLYKAPDPRIILASLFAIPALIDALAYIKCLSEEDKESLESLKWYQVIVSKLKEEKINLENETSLTNVANKIMPRIFVSTVEKLTDVCKVLLKEGEEE